MERKEITRGKIREANQETLKRMLAAEPLWVDVAMAGEVIPRMKKNLLLHAGPPQKYENMCGPQRGAAWGALIFEGLAKDAQEADHLLSKRKIRIESAHDHDSVAGAAQMISHSQPVIVLENRTNRKLYYTHMKEDTFVALRYGSYGEHTQKRLGWLRENIAPVLSTGLKMAGGVSCRDIIAKSLFMGDEGHNRNQAETLLFEQVFLPVLLKSSLSKEQILEVANLLKQDDNFFLYPVMASCKAMLDAGKDVPYSTIVTTMARNGTEFGIKVSGLGDRWFTAPAPMVKGLYFPGFSEKDTCPDLGDSCITETAGIGGFAMAASPAIVHFGTATGVGGSVQDAIHYTKEMYEITEAENPGYQIAYLDFRGCPTGIDVLKVLDTGIQPIINTSISPKEPGKSQAGAGLVRAPMGCFKKAFRAFVEKYRLASPS
ncbi:MAG TPA: DUF1116 domain-containing protein [Thermodesulfobacteriota bacterium]|nr:DUF1116 domain-containing protein [Thermodesulfobacteriota bacterium]